MPLKYRNLSEKENEGVLLNLGHFGGRVIVYGPCVVSVASTLSATVTTNPVYNLTGGAIVAGNAASPSTVVTVGGNSTGPLAAELVSFTRTETPKSINSKIDEVVDDPEMYDPGEDRPENEVVQGVKDLVVKTKARLGGRRFPEVIVRPFEGAVRLTWSSPSANVRLVYSKEPDHRYIYHEEIVNGKAVNTELIRDVSSTSLATWLKWFISR